MHERYQTILLDLHGVSKKDTSKIIGRSLSTVYNYINAYRQEGIQGLRIETPPGRQRFLNAEQEQRVYQTIVNQTPADVGFPAKMNWTSPIIRKWIEREFGVLYSDRGTRELLYRFMIDGRFQGQGHGYNAMLLVIDKLYTKSGFREDGLASWGEILAKYSFV
ncbi:helix-turn-helix domain-containing protein [Paenibacillus alkaliterrae]|uniref:helix-turn-helix domain-containing protein n=1 Tax=Paenibacillus alkaliterrae TaxID=320909 RepID=UPI001F4548D5|nr:helix-turn-helix domain-containing protein [Paenibacillus alkaliterrae]MCF2941600.1 helix-turn-helix domain-containing protein [Paenibacillus alkaliterrae]